MSSGLLGEPKWVGDYNLSGCDSCDCARDCVNYEPGGECRGKDEYYTEVESWKEDVE